MGTDNRGDGPSNDMQTAVSQLQRASSSQRKHAAVLTAMVLFLSVQMVCASEDRVAPGALYLGETPEWTWFGCVDEDEGIYYLAPNRATKSRAWDFRTWRMVRATDPAVDAEVNARTALQPATGRTPNSLLGRWLTAPEGSSVTSGMHSIDPGEQPTYLGRILISAGNADEPLTAELSPPVDGATADEAEHHKGPRFIVRKEADDCRGFEKVRLELPWQPTPQREDAFYPVPRGGAVDFESLVHPATGVRSIRLLPGPHLEQAQADAINREIEALVEPMNHEWSFCEYYEAEVRLAAASPRLVVLSWWDGRYCGGAHPNEDQGILSFDPASAAPFDVRGWLEPSRDLPLPPPLWDELAPMLEEACQTRLKDRDSYLSIWLSNTPVNVRIYEDARPYIYCEGDYPLAFDLVREVIRPEKLTEFDGIVESLTGGH